MNSSPSNVMAMASFSLSPETRRCLRESDKKWLIKFCLRSFAALLAFIGMLAVAAAIPEWNAHFFHSEGDTPGDWQDGLVIAPFVVGILYFIGSSVYMFKTTRLVHPGITMAADFLVWAILIPAITFSAWGGLFNVWRPAIKEEDGEVICDIFNILARECSPILYSVGGLELAAVILGCFVWCLHLFLFVWACQDLRVRRRNARNAKYQSFSFELEQQVQPSLQLPDFLAKDLELGTPARAAAKPDNRVK